MPLHPAPEVILGVRMLGIGWMVAGWTESSDSSVSLPPVTLGSVTFWLRPSVVKGVENMALGQSMQPLSFSISCLPWL